MAFKDKISEIEALLEKYYEAETSLKEEEILRDYFLNNSVPPHLQADKAQFVFFAEESIVDSVKELPSFTSKKKKKIKVFDFMRYAAAAVILISLGWFSNNQYQEQKRQDEIRYAYNETQEAFKLLATNFNKGLEGAESLKEMNKTQKKIIEKQYSK